MDTARQSGPARCFRALLSAALLAGAAGAQVWNEAGDAESFPDGLAQRTPVRSPLLSIVGRTDQASGDLRDAYCIRVAKPAEFKATTDPRSDPAAFADFDTRLSLFRTDGSPVLANDDLAPAQDPFLSELTGLASDGSGFVLSRPGEYVLVVAGSPDDPEDLQGVDLFDLASDPTGIHAPDPAAGRFHHWEGGATATGSYRVALSGVDPCGDLDVLLVIGNSPDRLCLNDGDGQMTCKNASLTLGSHMDVALGDFDANGHLDAVIGVTDGPNRICLGSGGVSFSCANVSAESNRGEGVAVGDMNGDGHLDAVFTGGSNADAEICLGDGAGRFVCSDIGLSLATGDALALGDLDEDGDLDGVIGRFGGNAICLGDGAGSFESCTQTGISATTRDVVLGDLNADGNLDAAFANDDLSQVCMGNGNGGFAFCMDLPESFGMEAVALGDLNHDQALDAVFANRYSTSNSLSCLGDGSGGFSCAEMTTEAYLSRGVELGDLDGDGNLDAVFVNLSVPHRLCLGDGTGQLTCSDFTTEQFGAIDLALGDFDPSAIFWDLFETGDTSGWGGQLP